jgi:hypothetical protein
MSDKARVHSIFPLNGANSQEFYDTTTHERVFAFTPIFYEEDFMGAGKSAAFPTSATVGSDWIKKTVQTGGTPTVGAIANAAFGQVQLALDATSEKQEASLYWADKLAVDVTAGTVIEVRAKLAVLPSATGVEAVFGLSSAWVDGPDNASEYLEFGANASGVMNMRSQDGTTQNAIASNFTADTTKYHVYRIDATVLTNVRYFVDGVERNTDNQIAFAATGSSAILQPYMSVYKASGTGVATLDIDYFKFWNAARD